ncbi:hypothetical protein C8F01DRAFT_164512 [Mycena amicta]|nr:hypothetical protein C8F01DRAFT_164512 [Mycena amicta]
MAHSMFPSIGFQALSACIHLLGVTILTLFLSLRVFPGALDDTGSSRGIWVHPTWPRLCVILVLLDSWLFLFSTGLLIFGVGLQMNQTSCAAGIYLCVLFYCTSKVLIYLFLTEKVYIVWGNGNRRLRSPTYLVCVGSVALYTAVMLAMFFGRIEKFREGDGACVLGLKPTASLPLLSYDLYINLLLTTLFIYPILRSKHSTPQMRRVALRTLMAAAVALTTSTVNIAVLTILKGSELGWVCLGSCGTDVIFNAAALFWVTSGRTQRSTLSGASGGVAGRQLSGTDSNGPGVVSLTHVPGTPTRPTNTLKSGDMFQMGDLGRAREFKIHVTTEQVDDRSVHGHGHPTDVIRMDSHSSESQKGVEV